MSFYSPPLFAGFQEPVAPPGASFPLPVGDSGNPPTFPPAPFNPKPSLFSVGSYETVAELMWGLNNEPPRRAYSPTRQKKEGAG
ncbi:MAG: hypothetical protein KME26_29110 [Oscillatoria princeps RMCB-10]|nr:hypothetical protein [Oscillatoria princeps RMCB-10]